ncbi:ABC transporter permease [Gluconacetobacter diazotrophicus]|uniref:ABC transporter permease n=2 Tax=Gluconacetobacter diazotrophicus TaxID=33996 RepID=A0A7W4FC19_GLUDI|nr:ABC transporter permease [Gluconacetobacter diazotrophicus]MBB2154976.1 ABC transporter permease [Gluconacetobacter diazotrophicus]CAP54407.1 putative ABC transporter, permease protein [Gluconacetobacter diazotrophicus PA1 5]
MNRFSRHLIVLRLAGLRILSALGTLLLVTILIFAATSFLPGDAAQAILGRSATPEAAAALRHSLHLDQPGWWRFLVWIGGMLHGDPGYSLINHAPVRALIGQRLPHSLLLAGLTALVTVPTALVLGITSAVFRQSWYDRTVASATIAVVSLPEFLVATFAVLVFAVELRWLPALSDTTQVHGPGDFLRAFAMPVISLSCVVIAQMIRMTRAAMCDALDAPYIEMARLKGCGPVRLVLVHALPNTIGALLNIIALSLSGLLGGVVVIETVFDYPGLAKLMVDAVATRDMPVIQACALIFCGTYLVLITLADVASILGNPRRRRS